MDPSQPVGRRVWLTQMNFSLQSPITRSGWAAVARREIDETVAYSGEFEFHCLLTLGRTEVEGAEAGI